MIERIKLMLGIEGEDALLSEIISLTQSKILNEIGEAKVPTELEFMLIEMSINRYNRIGSEGLKSESVDGRVQSYESDIEVYRSVIDKYLERKNQASKVRLF